MLFGRGIGARLLRQQAIAEGGLVFFDPVELLDFLDITAQRNVRAERLRLVRAAVPRNDVPEIVGWGIVSPVASSIGRMPKLGS